MITGAKVSKLFQLLRDDGVKSYEMRAKMHRFDLWPYSFLQGIADASIALRLLRSSFVIFAR